MNKRTITFLAMVVFVVLLFWSSGYLQDVFFRLVDIFSSLAIQHEFIAISLFVVTSAIAALISPLTNIPLIPIAVVIWGPVLTTTFLLTGWLIGDILAYFIGRRFGYKVVRYFVIAERLDDWTRMVKERMKFSSALLLRLALPAELGYAFGLVGYNVGAYILITFIAELPFAVISTYASEAVLYGDTIKFFGFVGMLFAIIFFAFRMKHPK